MQRDEMKLISPLDVLLKDGGARSIGMRRSSQSYGDTETQWRTRFQNWSTIFAFGDIKRVVHFDNPLLLEGFPYHKLIAKCPVTEGPRTGWAQQQVTSFHALSPQGRKRPFLVYGDPLQHCSYNLTREIMGYVVSVYRWNYYHTRSRK